MLFGLFNVLFDILLYVKFCVFLSCLLLMPFQLFILVIFNVMQLIIILCLLAC